MPGIRGDLHPSRGLYLLAGMGGLGPGLNFSCDMQKHVTVDAAVEILGFCAPGEYDLSGFAVGILERR